MHAFFFTVCLFLLIRCSESSGEETKNNSSDQKSVTITYIGNDGVYISDGKRAVIIDTLPGNLSGWRQVANSVQSQIENGTGNFTDIKAVLITHNHGDHYSTTSVNNFLSKHPQATLIAPPQVLANFNSGQENPVSPAFSMSDAVVVDSIRITVLHMRHFNQFGNDFSAVQNFAYIVEIGGKRIIHFGDVEYADTNFTPFNLSTAVVDLVLIPTFNTLISSENNLLIKNQVNPLKIVGLHLQSTTNPSTVRNNFPNAIIFEKSLDKLQL
ncbi:MAG: MBL fold metallo-hydrolase [Calditrichaeota bacterium]|nr:MBL fold metallo-hydrolase [Calditrichota bacterium]